ncbi:alpha/beta hydrolase [Rhizobium leguminosarum]
MILLFPGFGGVRDELQIPNQGKGIFAYIARSFASLGFSSLRIDFRGSGESDGLFENTTYSSQIADGIAAMEFLRSDPRVDGHRIFLLGWSQGGLVAAAIGGRTNRPSGIALWAAIGEPSVSFPALIGRETYLRGFAEESIATEIVMPWAPGSSSGTPSFKRWQRTIHSMKSRPMMARSLWRKGPWILPFRRAQDKNSCRPITGITSFGSVRWTTPSIRCAALKLSMRW